MAQTKITALLLLTQMQVTDELQLFLYFILKKNFNEYRTIVHDYTISDHHGTYSCVPAFLIPPFIHVCRGIVDGQKGVRVRVIAGKAGRELKAHM